MLDTATPPAPFVTEPAGTFLEHGMRLLWEERGPAGPLADPVARAATGPSPRPDMRIVGALRFRRRSRPLGDPFDAMPFEAPSARLPKLSDLLGAAPR